MRAGALLVLVLAVPVGASEPPPTPALTEELAAVDDARLRGYVESWLEYVHGLGPDRVEVGVAEGVVTLRGIVGDPETIDRIVATVASFRGVVEVVDELRVAAPEKAPGRWRGWRDWLLPPPGRKAVRFPGGELFAPPLADQKQPRFHTTWQRYRTDFGTFNVASVGFGESFGLVRWPREREGDGWQLGISGAVFAIFNLDAPSNDLLNADYIVGFPLSYRGGAWSARARVFHQSSHLGDEFLLMPQPGPPVERINLSYEALELLGSWERRGLRVYGGGVQIFASSTPLGRSRAQLGLELRGRPLGWKTARVVAGLDVEAWDETDWDRDFSFKAGLLFRSPYGNARSVQLLLEYYDGHAPHGQFYPLEVEYFGLGVAYAF